MHVYILVRDIPKQKSLFVPISLVCRRALFFSSAYSLFGLRVLDDSASKRADKRLTPFVEC